MCLLSPLFLCCNIIHVILMRNCIPIPILRKIYNSSLQWSRELRQKSMSVGPQRKYVTARIFFVTTRTTDCCWPSPNGHNNYIIWFPLTIPLIYSFFIGRPATDNSLQIYRRKRNLVTIASSRGVRSSATLQLAFINCVHRDSVYWNLILLSNLIQFAYKIELQV